MQNSLEEPVADSGREFVFDSRKLIVAFGLLIAVCGCFFVIGFVEGKRQGFQAGIEQASTNVPPRGESLSQQRTTKKPAPEPARNAPEERPVGEQLEWYRKVVKGSEPGAEHASAGGEKTAPATAGVKSTTQSSAIKPAVVTYSVQVGAYRLLKEAESKGESLKTKGYKFTIDPPGGPNQLYLLKVGKFESRADAAAMQLKLKKDGFATFIKTN